MARAAAAPWAPGWTRARAEARGLGPPGESSTRGAAGGRRDDVAYRRYSIDVGESDAASSVVLGVVPYCS